MSRNTDQYFNGFYGRDDYEFSPREQALLDGVLSLFPDEDTLRVLDVGCGVGSLARSLQKKPGGRMVVSTDLSIEGVRRAPSPRLVCEGATLPFADASFDLVSCCEVLEHLPESLGRRVVDELRRVSRRYVLITVPNRELLENALVQCPRCASEYNPHRHIRVFSVSSFTTLIPDFRPIKVREFGPIQHDAPVWWGRLRRLLLGPICAPPWDACPICGYTGGTDVPSAAQIAATRRPRGLRARIQESILCSDRSTWVGGLFVRN